MSDLYRFCKLFLTLFLKYHRSSPKNFKKKSPYRGFLQGIKKNLAATYSPTLLCAVPSAMKGLTSEFGMGSGISPSLLPPSKI